MIVPYYNSALIWWSFIVAIGNQNDQSLMCMHAHSNACVHQIAKLLKSAFIGKSPK